MVMRVGGVWTRFVSGSSAVMQWREASRLAGAGRAFLSVPSSELCCIRLPTTLYSSQPLPRPRPQHRLTDRSRVQRGTRRLPLAFFFLRADRRPRAHQLDPNRGGEGKPGRSSADTLLRSAHHPHPPCARRFRRTAAAAEAFCIGLVRSISRSRGVCGCNCRPFGVCRWAAEGICTFSRRRRTNETLLASLRELSGSSKIHAFLGTTYSPHPLIHTRTGLSRAAGRGS